MRSMEETIQHEKLWSVLILVILVVLFCGFGIKTAYDQRNERLRWQEEVANTFTRHTQKIEALNNDVQYLKGNFGVLNDKVDNLQQSYQQQSTEHFAGCYGVLPQGNQTTFSLQCNKDFFK